MKKLMILGAGYSQIPLVRAARRLGYETIATSIPGDYPGFFEADSVCYADISKPEEVLYYAKELGIDGITTCAMDTGICSAGLVCDELTLNGISYEAAQKAVNKYQSKLAFQEHGVPCADARVVSSEEELRAAYLELGFPVVIKAVDLMGSRGVYRAGTEEEALEAYSQVRKETRQGYCLVEEFLEGVLFGAEGMIQDHNLVFLLPYGTEVYDKGAIATSLGHDAPFQYHQEYETQIRQLLIKAANALGLNNTPFNCDLILKDQQVYLIEINGRAGASCLSETVGIYYGVDYYECICRQAMRENLSEDFKLSDRKPVPNLSRILTAPARGILKKAESGQKPGGNLVDVSFNVEIGEPVKVYENGKDRIGQIIIKGETREACCACLEKVMNEIVIVVEEEQNGGNS